MEDRGWRTPPAEWSVVANIDPRPAGHRLASGKDRYGRVVAVHPVTSEHMRSDEVIERPQERDTAADLVGQGRQAEINTLPPIALGLAIERLVLAKLLEQYHRQQARSGEAAGQHMEWCWRLADPLAGSAGELLADILQ